VRASNLVFILHDLTQFHNRCDVEFLPVYYPNSAEQLDPKLYAANVRDVMAAALNVPLTEYVYEDSRVLLKVEALDFARAINYIDLLRKKHNLSETEAEKAYISEWLSEKVSSKVLNKQAVGELMGLDQYDHTLNKIFNAIDKSGSGVIDGHLYAVLLAWTGTAEEAAAAANKLFNSLNLSKKAFITLDDFQSAMCCTQFSKDDALRIYQQIDLEHNGKVTVETFSRLIRLKPEYLKLFAHSYKAIHTAKCTLKKVA